jgi:hypothetical protein
MHRCLTQLQHTKGAGRGSFDQTALSKATRGGSFFQIVVIPVSDPEPLARRFCRPFSWERDGRAARSGGIVIPTREVPTATGPQYPGVAPWV